MKVKICGIRTVEEALMTAAEKPDFIGMVFAPSKRQIDYSTAREISDASIDSYIKTVGVFVNLTNDEADRVYSETAIDYIQFHGDEDKALVEQYQNRAIKAFHSNSDLSCEARF